MSLVQLLPRVLHLWDLEEKEAVLCPKCTGSGQMPVYRTIPEGGSHGRPSFEWRQEMCCICRGAKVLTKVTTYEIPPD